jgi:hypothetical protein
VAGKKPLERLRFLVPEQEHFFDLNSGTIIDNISSRHLLDELGVKMALFPKNI